MPEGRQLLWSCILQIILQHSIIPKYLYCQCSHKINETIWNSIIFFGEDDVQCHNCDQYQNCDQCYNCDQSVLHLWPVFQYDQCWYFLETLNRWHCVVLPDKAIMLSCYYWYYDSYHIIYMIYITLYDWCTSYLVHLTHLQFIHWDNN